MTLKERYHPSVYIAGLIAFVVLAHNASVKMQVAAGIIYFGSVALFLLCPTTTSR